MGRNEKAVREDLRVLGGTKTSPALFALAVSLALVLDDTTSARDIATVTKELRATLAEMRALAHGQPGEASTSDDLAKRRADRIARLAAGQAS